MRSLVVTDLNFLEVIECPPQEEVQGGSATAASGLSIQGPFKVEGDVQSFSSVTTDSSQTAASGDSNPTGRLSSLEPWLSSLLDSIFPA